MGRRVRPPGTRPWTATLLPDTRGRPSSSSALSRSARRAVCAAAMLIGLIAGQPGSAATLRIASAFDPQTMDPHGVALLYHARVVFQLYDSLVNHDEQFRLEPSLALSWQALTPTSWRFKLRPAVSFHDGSPFTADDAVFSISRAMGPTSQRAFQLKGVVGVVKVDALTINVQLAAPDAVLPLKFANVPIMSKAWCIQHGVERAQDFAGKQETFAVRHANGTGPFALDRYEPDVRAVLKRNPRWWGWGEKRSGNLDEVVFIPIRSDATRLAALVSGEVDFVFDPPVPDIERLGTDPALRLLHIADLGQQYLVMDQQRNVLDGSDETARNPFKDVRVRRAVYQAINVDLIARKLLRGQATPTGAFLSPQVDGSPAALDRRLPFDPAKARALLAEAGYPKGFSVTLDCVNVAWREAVCQAIAAMLTQSGIRTTMRSSPTNQFFPKLTQATVSLAEFGWTPTSDAWSSLNALFHSFDPAGAGGFNGSRYSNPALDALIDQIRVEPDRAQRRTLVAKALAMIGDDLPFIPLYRRTLTWAMGKKVQAVQWPNDELPLRWVRMP